MDTPAQTDRYISFCGIECDNHADQLINMLRNQLKTLDSGSLWYRYFQQKFDQQLQLGHDNLFYVGAQLNNLYAFFEEVGDECALTLLYKLEMECC